MNPAAIDNDDSTTDPVTEFEFDLGSAMRGATAPASGNESQPSPVVSTRPTTGGHDPQAVARRQPRRRSADTSKPLGDSAPETPTLDGDLPPLPRRTPGSASSVPDGRRTDTAARRQTEAAASRPAATAPVAPADVYPGSVSAAPSIGTEPRPTTAPVAAATATAPVVPASQKVASRTVLPSDTPPAPQPAAPQMSVMNPEPGVADYLQRDSGTGHTLMPTLPEQVQAAASKAVDPTVHERRVNPADIGTFRRAQQRSSKQQRKGRVFSRFVLAMMLLGGLVAGSLTIGSDYLFGVEWDATTMPLVQQLETRRGEDFKQPVAVVAQPPSDFASTAAAWAAVDEERLSTMRALGLAGPADLDQTAASIAAARPAIYDSSDRVIYRSAGVIDESSETALKVALNESLNAQLRTGDDVAPAEGDPAQLVQPGAMIAAALDEYLLSLGSPFQATEQAETVLGLTRSATDVVDELNDVRLDIALPETVEAEAAPGADVQEAAEPLVGLPAVVQARVSVDGTVGERIATAWHLDPSTVKPTGIYEGEIASAIPAAPSVAQGGLLDGSSWAGEPTAVERLTLGLIFIDQLGPSGIDLVTASSVQPFLRGDQRCVTLILETSTAEAGDVMFAAANAWVSNAPASSAASLTRLAPHRTQMNSCDPGSEARTPSANAVDSAVETYLVGPVVAAGEAATASPAVEPTS